MHRARAGDVAERARARRRPAARARLRAPATSAPAADVFAERRKRRNDAVVVGYSGTLRRASTLQADVRRDDNSAYGGNTTGRIGYAVESVPALKLRALAGTTFRAPTFNDLFYPGFGVPTVQPERGRSIEVGRRAGRATRRASSATLYRNRVRDLIGFEPDRSFCPADSGLRLRLRRATSAARGCKARRSAATAALARASTLRASVDFLDAQDADTGVRLTRRAAHQESVGADYDAGAWTRRRRRRSFVGSRPDSRRRPRRLRRRSTCAPPGGSQPRWQLEAQLPNALDRTRRAGARLPRPRPPGLARRPLRVGRACERCELRHASDDRAMMTRVRALVLAVVAAAAGVRPRRARRLVGLRRRVARDHLASIRVPRVLAGFGAGAALARLGRADAAADAQRARRPVRARRRRRRRGRRARRDARRRRRPACSSRSGASPAAPRSARRRRRRCCSACSGAASRSTATSAGGDGAAALLLVGVMIGSGCSALVSLILTLADEGQLRGMVFWLLGDLNGATQWEIVWLALAIALAAVWPSARELDWLARGDAWAATLGVPVGRRRRTVLLAAALATGAAVATAGAIGFVGLVVPHALRRLGVRAAPLLLPASAIARRRVRRRRRRGRAHGRRAAAVAGRRARRRDRRADLHRHAAAPAGARR